MHLFPRGRNSLERKPVGGAHFNWLHVLEGPHRGRGPREPPSISTLPPGTLGPVLSIWPAAPVRSPSQQDQRCGGRVLGGGSESRRPCIREVRRRGQWSRYEGRRPWPPGSRLLQQQKGTRFLLQASVPGTAPAHRPGNEGPCPLVLSPGCRRRRPRLGTPALRPPARPLSRPRESWASGQAAGAPWGHRTGLIM